MKSLTLDAAKKLKKLTITWEQCRFEKLILDIADGPFGSNLKTEHYTTEKEARIVQLSNLSDYGWVEENTKYTTVNHANEIKRCIIKKDNLIIGKMMPAGMTIICPRKEKMYVLSSDCVRVELNQKDIINEFFLYVTKSEYFLSQVNNDSQGSTRIRTSITKIKKMLLNIPKKEEQIKIGKQFHNIDNLITLHQRKDLSIFVKKLWLIKPKTTHTWEQCKFGDYGSVAMCKRIFKEQTNDVGDVPFYKIGTFGKEPDAYISRELFKEYKEKFNYPQIGDILISASGTIGRIVEYSGADEYFQDSNIVWFKHDNRIASAYLKCVYSFVKWIGIEGSTIKRLYNDNYMKTEFPMTNIEEQKKIGNAFNQLDSLITLHQHYKVLYGVMLWKKIIKRMNCFVIISNAGLGCIKKELSDP